MTKLYRNLKNLEALLLNFKESYFFGSSRYSRIKMSIATIMFSIVLIFLAIVLIRSHLWLMDFIKGETKNQLVSQLETSKGTIELLIAEKLSALRFIASQYSYAKLIDETVLYSCLQDFKKAFGEIVDIGVIDSKGVMRAYVGPYDLKKKYAKEEWFEKLLTREEYVSSVSTNSTFVIAVKNFEHDKKGFWVLRITVDVEFLKEQIAAIKMKDVDDVFIVNHDGILQTNSKFYGKLLDKYPLEVPHYQQGINILDFVKIQKKLSVIGYTYIKNSPWILMYIAQSMKDTHYVKTFLKEMVTVFIISIIILILITLRMAHVMVKWMKEADRKRDEAISEIEHSNRLASIGRLAAGVAHEINNPISIINQKAGLMKDILDINIETSNPIEFQNFVNNSKNKDKFISLINGIIDAVARCRTITHRLLGFARNIETALEPFDLNVTIKEVIGFLDKEIHFRDVILITNLYDRLSHIISNKGEIQQVLLNIINNALDAVERGGTIEIATGMVDLYNVYISIEDNGYGIDSAHLKNIFEPFFTTKERGKGTGLGLFISYGIVKKLGGNISVESELNRGTKFTIQLPVKNIPSDKKAF
ncbi:MAG: ATP-binding protein [Candidatus Magnetoovum sp. WYHC-5]|nr:ATP-binding protein [Candidatus Magnetoovum sp. WYHC-5]